MTYQEDREKLEQLKKELNLRHDAYEKSLGETIAFIDEMLKKAIYCESYEIIKNSLSKNVVKTISEKCVQPINKNCSEKDEGVYREKKEIEQVKCEEVVLQAESFQFSNNIACEDISNDYYNIIDNNAKKVIDEFIHNYHNNTLPKVDKVLKISREFGKELAFFNKSNWDDYSKKNQLVLQEDDTGSFEAYLVPDTKDRFFVIPRKFVKFSSNRVIIDGFAGFFDFNLDMAIDGMNRTPYVERPALVAERNGIYKLCTIKDILCKGKIEF